MNTTSHFRKHGLAYTKLLLCLLYCTVLAVAVFPALVWQPTVSHASSVGGTDTPCGNTDPDHVHDGNCIPPDNPCTNSPDDPLIENIDAWSPAPAMSVPGELAISGPTVVCVGDTAAYAFTHPNAAHDLDHGVTDHDTHTTGTRTTTYKLNSNCDSVVDDVDENTTGQPVADSITYDWSVNGGGSIAKDQNGRGLFTAPTTGGTVTIQALFSDGAPSASEGSRDDVPDQPVTLEVTVVKLSIEAEYIDQDAPTNTNWTNTAGNPAVVYGGSEPSTADNLRLTAKVWSQTVTPIRYHWSVTGPAANTLTPPSPATVTDTWDVGDIPPNAGLHKFKCDLELQSGYTISVTKEVEFGIRTDDYIVIGWINQAGVPVPAGASVYVTNLFPPGGPPLTNLNFVEASLFLFQLSECTITPNLHFLSAPDRTYLINWLFRYANNPNPNAVIPLGSFRNLTDTYINYARVNLFRSSNTNYKLFNHLQVRYRIGQNGFAGTPTAIHATTSIGHTPSPIGTIFGFPGPAVGQIGPNNGPPHVLPPPGNHRISLINDGSPPANAIRAFNTLAGQGVASPVYWENIIFQIRFTWQGGVSATILVQPYPTYYIYRNGRHVNTIAQAASPLGNFAPNPYPFGTVNCIRPGGITPGGRCGNATATPHASSRIVPVMIP